MKIGLIAENIVQWLALKLELIPKTVEISASILHAQTIITATKLDIFEAIGSTPLTAKEVAETCRADNDAMIKLLNSLVGLDLGCLKHNQLI